MRLHSDWAGAFRRRSIKSVVSRQATRSRVSRRAAANVAVACMGRREGQRLCDNAFFVAERMPVRDPFGL